MVPARQELAHLSAFYGRPVLITGGAGFIGSHLVDRILKVSESNRLKVLDNLSTGRISNIHPHIKTGAVDFIKMDLRDSESLRNHLKDTITVFHAAADPEVRTGYTKPQLSFNLNIRNTFRLLEQVRKSKIENFLFLSSSTVYGEPGIIPTPEFYGPLIPISHYGASKLACEALVSSYCNTYGIKAQIFRLANIIGKRSTHGIIWDFINKLRIDNDKLEILGNGRQTKSYLHVSDCIESMLFCSLRMSKGVELYNIGNDDAIDVISIANLVCRSLRLKNVNYLFNTQIADGRGWIGDVRTMRLDISKIKKLGWHPKLTSKQSVVQTCYELS